MDKKTTIEQLVLEEYMSANEKFPMFSSSHEAWAVLKEEAEEFSDECYGIFNPMYDLWRFVRANNVNSQKEILLLIKNHALRASEELIQVMAMIHKYEMYLAQFPEEKPF